MGKFLSHAPCPACPSSDGLAIYLQDTGTTDATCFVCETYFPNFEYMPAPMTTPPSPSPSLSSIASLPIGPLSDRGLTASTCAFYGVCHASGDVYGSDPVAHYYPYYKGSQIASYKAREVATKRFYTIGDHKGVDLFGQHLFEMGAKRLFITEGECDALALFQVLKELAGLEFKHLNPCVVSLPNGSTSVAKSLELAKDFLSKFESITLCFDQDEAGQKATLEAFSCLDPSKVRVCKLSEKDANQMLLSNKKEELKWSCINAETYTPSGIVTGSDLIEHAVSPVAHGRSWPWPTLTRLTFGRVPSVYGIGAGVGIGKTEFFHELIYHIVAEEKRDVGIFLLEEPPQTTIKILGGKALSIPVHRPDQQFDPERLRSAIDGFGSKVYIFDHRGERDWRTIRTQVRHLIAARGVKDIFLDPLTAIISQEENTDRALHSMMDEISRFTHDPYNACVYYSSHLNEPPRDKVSHEEGGRVTESQFAGSRAMVRYSDYIIGLERNKQDTDILQRNTTTLRILKDRRFGFSTGSTFKIFYDHKTGRYLEAHKEF